MSFPVQKIKVTGKITALKFGGMGKYKKSQAVSVYWEEKLLEP